MNADFDAWVKSWNISSNNPHKEFSPEYWMYEGWYAGVLHEREACARICDRYASVYLDRRELSDWESGYVDGATECFDAIRARGEE